MSNGYHRLARIETDDGMIYIDQGWGSYAEFSVSINESTIALTREQYGELLRQMNEYGPTATYAQKHRWTAQRLDALADRTGPTGMSVDDDIPS